MHFNVKAPGDILEILEPHPEHSRSTDLMTAEHFLETALLGS